MPRALVTGGNRGLGFETCRQLSERGFEVLLAARNPKQGRTAAERLGGKGGSSAVVGNTVKFVELDVADPSSVERLTGQLSGQPPLDVLVNNAGVSLKGFDANVVERTLEVNYRGAVRVTDALLPLLTDQANIVMVSSGMGELSAVSPELREALLAPRLDRAGLDGLVQQFVDAVRADRSDLGGWPSNAYRVSKAAVNAFTRILARDLDGSGRRVNAVCPGWVRTDMGGAAAGRSVEQGASGIIWAATLGAEGPNGGFFRDSKAISW